MATQNLRSGRTVAQQGVDDLVMLPKVSEKDIVENIKKRYKHDLIYTYIGPVLISVNPYKALNNTGQQLVPLYHEHFPHENPPHLYALGEEAYRTMKGNYENQCILISGESGAGKTEAAKIIMGFISFVTGGGQNVEYVKSIVLESNPLLEAFGNAKTLRNNNSSRFGKYFEIQFDGEHNPCGGKITNYLLEKSRVVYQQQGERNFHFFYNILTDQQACSKYQLFGPGDFYYTNQGSAPKVDGINDAEDYKAVRHAMGVVGMDAAEQENVLMLVAGILHLGNVAFADGAKGHAQVQDPNSVQMAAYLLQVDAQTLTTALTFRHIQTGGGKVGGRGSTYNVPQNPGQAYGSKDALARDLYSRLFDWIVLKANTALSAYKIPHQTVIGILDIFGFEIFQNNGFEQFCINYVNEKLQQYFIELTLKAEQEDYVKEGIQWTPIDYFNNKVVCELCEGKVGLFSLLDDICFTIHAESGTETDFKFLEKAVGLFSQHQHFASWKEGFQVKHYAGDVSYNISGFSDKNKDTLFADLIQTMQTSSNRFFAGLFPETMEKGGQKKRPTTAGFKIKTSANELMATLSQCAPHYVRCIKPNDHKKANDWDEARVAHQAQYLGLLENVRVRRAGFAYRAPFERFLRRYKKLSPNTWGIRGEWTGAPRGGCETICNDLQLAGDQWQMGKTKIFIRHPETLFHLEEMIERKEFHCACLIQKGFSLLKRAKQAAMISNLVRGNKERRRESVGRRFQADYINFKSGQVELKEAIKQFNGGKDEEALFADSIMKVNRRGKPEKRFFIITNDAFYIVSTAIKKKVLIYNVTRRTALADITGITMSTLQDNIICLHVPREYDNVIENDKKTEIAAVVMYTVEALTRSKPQLNFSDVITYKIKSGGNKQMKFMKNEKFPVAAVSGGKVQVGTGLPKDTDTAPKISVKPFTGGNAQLGSGYKSAGPTGGGAPMGGASRPMGGGGGGGGGERVRALFDFNAENEDELTFRAGEIIEVVGKDGDWWTGSLRGTTGLFPANYVEPAPGGGGAAQPAARGGPRGGGVPRGMGGPPRGGGAPRGMGGPPRGGPPRGGGPGGPRGGAPRGMGGPPRGGAPRGMGMPPPRGRGY